MWRFILGAVLVGMALACAIADKDDEEEEDAPFGAPDDSDDTGEPDVACDGLEGEGTAVGQVSPDFALLDAGGDRVHLYDYCDRYVYLVFGAMWDGATVSNMPDYQDLYEAYGDRRAMVVLALIGNTEHGPVTPEELASWSEEYGAEYPVLSDTEAEVLYTYASGGSIGIPFTVVLDPGAVIFDVDYPSVEDFRAHLEE